MEQNEAGKFVSCARGIHTSAQRKSLAGVRIFFLPALLAASFSAKAHLCSAVPSTQAYASLDESMAAVLTGLTQHTYSQALRMPITATAPRYVGAGRGCFCGSLRHDMFLPTPP